MVPENSRWCLGCLPDKVVRKTFGKEPDLILLLVDYYMSSPNVGLNKVPLEDTPQDGGGFPANEGFPPASGGLMTRV
jgi:hypothetical protein